MDLLFRGADVDPTAGLVRTVDAPHTAPCRRCLVDAEPGEDVVLVSHDPFDVDSPYRSASPVFVHARPCTRAASGRLPEQQRSRLLSVRSFDAAGVMLDCEVVDGAEAEPLLRRYLGRSDAAVVHVHNARAGCFAVRVERG